MMWARMNIRQHNNRCWKNNAREFDYPRIPTPKTRPRVPGIDRGKAYRFYIEQRHKHHRMVAPSNKFFCRFWKGNHDLRFLGVSEGAAAYTAGYTTKAERDSWRKDFHESCEIALKEHHKNRRSRFFFPQG